MIFAKINPPANIPVQNSAFNFTSVTGSYFTATTNQYELGAQKVNFFIQYGNCIFDENQNVIGFERLAPDFITLQGSELDNWGTDDSVILYTIATKQGTSVVEIVSGDISI